MYRMLLDRLWHESQGRRTKGNSSYPAFLFEKSGHYLIDNIISWEDHRTADINMHCLCKIAFRQSDRQDSLRAKPGLGFKSL